MHSTICLNCDTKLAGKFCHECGQKSDTHRITPRHFVIHDLMHGVFHIDKGILFTLRETFTRPGYAALDYVSGKRKNYYNIFYLMFLILGFYLIANGHDASVKEANKNFAEIPETPRSIITFLVIYVKYLMLIIIPLFALSSFIVFQRLEFNYAEHVILNGFVALGSFIFMLLGALIIYMYANDNDAFFYTGLTIQIFAPLLFTFWAYRQATKKRYSFWEYIARMIPFFSLTLIWAFTALLVLFLIMINK